MPKKKIILISLSLILSAILFSYMTPKSDKLTKNHAQNHLSDQKSPYLLQHAQNPIWWYPWGEEAFSVAKKQNKPIFLSIGYSTCYWCHFMEKDSFEKQDVADVLNEHFISIKVDREERPDVDQIYMTALVNMNGQGGWPVSMFMTPDGKPFYGQSTIMHDVFIDVLGQVAATWEQDPDRILQGSEQFSKQLQAVFDHASTPVSINKQTLNLFTHSLGQEFDESYGGFGGAPKFPRPHMLSALLRSYRHSQDADTLYYVTRTLDGMIRGGFHDILGGGFHRYSVDEKWLIPHFEKMLYDNALMVKTLLETYQVSKDETYLSVAKQTLDFLLEDMRDKKGGFHSAYDAGEVDEEGEYYGWTYEELSQRLTEKERDFLGTTFHVKPDGNFEEHLNILFLTLDQPWSLTTDKTYLSLRKKLLKARRKRPTPRLDDKIITAWNGMMISALAKAYQVTLDERYLTAAQEVARFIQDYMLQSSGHLYRRWRDGEAFGEGIINDYAYVIEGLMELYQTDFDEEWMVWAKKLQTLCDADFWDNETHRYFYDRGNDPTLVVRPKEEMDMAMPAGNSIMALNLLKWYSFTYDAVFKNRGHSILSGMMSRVELSPTVFGQLMMAYDYVLDTPQEIAVVGDLSNPKTQSIRNAVWKDFIPNKVLAMGHDTNGHVLKLLQDKQMLDGKPTVYVCRDGACDLPRDSF